MDAPKSPTDPNFMAAAAAYYQSRYPEMLARYVGPGKRFSDEASFRKYVGGEGKGVEQFFGGGVYADSDTDLNLWARIGQAGNGSYNGLAADGSKLLTDPKFRAFLSAYNPADPSHPLDPGATDRTYQQWADQVMVRLDDFSKQMGKPLDQLLKEGDLGARSATDMGANQAATQAYGRGLGGGGISALNTQRAALSAGLGYQQNRQAMGLQATQGLMGALQNKSLNDQQINLQLQNAQANAEAYSAAQHQAMMQAAGSVLGGVAGGVASYAGGGSFSGGYQTGSQIGGGLGGIYGAQGYQPYQYRPPTSSPTTSSGSGGGGSNHYGGSQ